MDMKLEDRYELLKLVIAEEIPGRIEIHPHIVGTTVTDVTDALERIIEERCLFYRLLRSRLL